jgi:membrane associated rhomboid family serine protease
MTDRTPDHTSPGAISPGSSDPIVVPDGPLTRELATAILARADELMAAADFRDAAAYYQRVVGFPDPAVTSAALIGLGEALYRMDEDAAAVATWKSVLDLPETPSTYVAWRNVAAARVREDDLPGAIQAYREAERRAPPEAKAEIANRLGWLAKETGDAGAARRYFAKGRGDTGRVPLSYIVIGVTAIVSLVALSLPQGGVTYDDVHIDLFRDLQLDKQAVANGEYWRLLTVTLLHASYLHLFFNMYALYLVGPLVEQLYGWKLFGLFYLLCAAAASVASFVFGGDVPAVGASGGIFGLFGVLLAVSRTHNPIVDRRGRMLMSQIGGLIVVNLVIGFIIPFIDNTAHIGGLLAGLWLGFLVPPGRVRTMRSMWQGVAERGAGALVLRTLGVLALVVVIVAGLAIGTQERHGRPGVGEVGPSADGAVALVTRLEA